VALIRAVRRHGIGMPWVTGGAPEVYKTLNVLWVLSDWTQFFGEKAVFWILVLRLLVIIITVIIIRHEMGLDSPVCVSSNSLIRGVPSRCPFDL
jgi:hypothetical protein